MDYNPYLVVPFATWAVAQLLKFSYAASRGRLDFRYLYASGGMPSVHSAVVTSLAVTAFLVDGPGSAIFGLAAVLAGIVMYDSLGVRRAAGEQAAALNVLMDSLTENRLRLAQPVTRLREVLGHHPTEVLVGFLLGLILGIVFNLDRAQPLTSFLSQLPAGYELLVYAVTAGLLLLGALVFQVVSIRLRGTSFVRAAWLRRLAAVLGGSALALGVVSLFAYERVTVVGSRGAIILVLLAMLGGVGMLARRAGSVRTEAEIEAEEQRKAKWLPPSEPVPQGKQKAGAGKKKRR